MLSKIKKYIKKYTKRFYVILLITLFFIAYLWNHIFIFIHPGQAGVKWERFKGGTVVNGYRDEGTSIIFPWDKIYVYNTRIQTVADSLSVLTLNGLTMDFEFSIRYRPKKLLVGMLHKTVGPEYQESVIVPEVKSILRSIIGRYKPYDIYTSQKAITEEINQESILRLESKYIEIIDVLLKKIVLPEKIKIAIEEKLEQEQIAISFDFKLDREKKEAERKKIESQGIYNFNKKVSESITPDILKFQGIRATEKIAESQNAKVIIIGAGEDGLPIILGGQ